MEFVVSQIISHNKRSLPPPSLTLNTNNMPRRMWWFEVFETFRKLALTGVLVVLSPGTAVQILVSIIMCILSMRIYSGCKPFIEDSHDHFSECAQWQLLATMLGALAMKVDIDGEDLKSKENFDWLLFHLQLLPALLILIGDKLSLLGKTTQFLQTLWTDFIPPLCCKSKKVSPSIGGKPSEEKLQTLQTSLKKLKADLSKLQEQDKKAALSKLQKQDKKALVSEALVFEALMETLGNLPEAKNLQIEIRELLEQDKKIAATHTEAQVLGALEETLRIFRTKINRVLIKKKKKEEENGTAAQEEIRNSAVVSPR